MWEDDIEAENYELAQALIDDEDTLIDERAWTW